MNRAALVAASLFFAPLAVAQEPPPPPPPPPPVESEPPLAPPSTPSAVDHADEGRIRWGVNAQVGAYVPQIPMVQVGGEGRVGWSFNRLFAVYANVGFGGGMFVGGSGGSGAGSGSITIGDYYFVGAMGELNLGDVFFAGAGLAAGNMSIAGLGIAVNTNNGGANEHITAVGGWGVSPDLRLGFSFGRRNPETGRRGGFTLALDLRFWFPPEQIAVDNGTGGQSFRFQNAFGVAPMLMLGYDSR